MEFLITKNPEVALTLIPWFVPLNQSREDIYLELRERLTDNPDETFVCVAIEDNLIKGMVVAYVRYKDVLIWQSRNEGLSRSIVDFVFNGVCHWARSKGFDRVTTVPNRARKIWVRRWGFRESKENKDEVFKEL